MLKYLNLLNSVMLTKMTWRDDSNPNTFWVRVLKGIYHQNTEFIQAWKRFKASWGWLSILVGRDILREYGIWIIGSSEMINVFGDAWIPNLSNFKLSVNH